MNKYKVIFLFSLMPYAAFILMLLIVSVSGYGYNLGKQAHGLAAAGNWLGDFGEFWFDFNIRHIIAFACVIYQIIYLLGLRKQPHKEHKHTGKAAKVFIWLSFAPYVLLPLISVGTAFFGVREWALFGGGSTIFGLEAFLQTLILGAAVLVIIPIIPLCLIYQIIYLVVKKRQKNKVHMASEDITPGPIENHERLEAPVQRNNSKAVQIALIMIFTTWGIVCLALSGLFSFSSDDPYIDPVNIQRTADFSFSYTNDYTEQNLIPAGATRYVHFDEMRLYWHKNNSFGYNELRETDEMFMGRNDEYDIILTWEGEGEIKAIYAVGSYNDSRFYYPPGDPLGNILDIYIEMRDGRLLERGGTFTSA